MVITDDANISEKMMTKRNGTLQALSLQKITSRLEALLPGLAEKHMNIGLIANKVF